MDIAEEDEYSSSCSSGSMTPRSTLSSYSEADSDEEEVDCVKKKKITVSETAVVKTGELANRRRNWCSYLSLRVAAKDPLEVPEILEHIYKLLPPQRVKELRLVNKQWDSVAVTYLRPKTKFTYDEPNKDKKKDVLDGLIKLRKTKTIPFTQFVTKFIPEEPDHLEEDFLETFGHQLKTFSIDIGRIENEDRKSNEVYEDLRFASLMRSVLLRWMPDLEEVELRGHCRNLSFTTFDKTGFKKLTLMPQRMDGEKWRPLLNLCSGSLESLYLRHISEMNRGPFLDSLLPGSELNKLMGTIPFHNLSYLEMSLATTGNPEDLNCLWNNRIRRVKIDLMFQLQDQDRDAHRYRRMMDRPEWSGMILRILANVKMADLVLTMGVCCETDPLIYRLCPGLVKLTMDNQQQHLPNLTHLRLSIPSIFGLTITDGIDFVLQMPNLDVFHLNHDTMYGRMISSLFVDGLSTGTLLIRPHLKLRALCLKTVGHIDQLTQIPNFFPNLKKIDVAFRDNEDIPENMLKLFKNSSLEEMTIRMHFVFVHKIVFGEATVSSLKSLKLISNYHYYHGDCHHVPIPNEGWASKMTNLRSFIVEGWFKNEAEISLWKERTNCLSRAEIVQKIIDEDECENQNEDPFV